MGMVSKIHAYHPTILPQHNNKQTNSITSFSEVLGSKQSLQFSKHAEQRMVARNITLTEQKWNQIENKLQEASQKGIKESLIITEKAAFIANAKSKTVITALDKSEMNSKIFTNITGTIVIE